MARKIENILFDIGRVLVHLRYGRVLPRIMARCSPFKVLRSRAFFALFSRDPMVAEYELGHITAARFFEHFVSVSGFRGSFEEFVAIWRRIFAENVPMIRFGRELSHRHAVYFLTNAGDLHVPYVYDAFPALRFFRDDAVSYQLHALKPSPEFYQRALQKFGVSPGTCLFVDDLPENVHGAEACGIPSLLYTTPADTIARIRRHLAADRA